MPSELSSELHIKDKDLLPIAPPSIQVFDEKKTFFHFDENTLELYNFFKTWEKSCMFGKEAHLLTDKGLRKLIQHRNFVSWDCITGFTVTGNPYLSNCFS